MSEQPWKLVKLGDYSQVKARIGWRGLSASEYTEEGPFLIAGKHIANGSINWDTVDHISEFRYLESSEIALDEGDVILSKDGTIGRVARIDSLPGKATLNGTMMLLRPNAGLDYRYLSHVLNGATFKKVIEDKVSGSSIPHIFQRDMVQLELLLPPQMEQRCIAQTLDALDTQIRRTEALIAKLGRIKQGLLTDLLTRGIDQNGQLRPTPDQAPHLYKDSPLGRIPREWGLIRLGALIEQCGGKIQTGPFGSQLHAEEYVSDGVPVVMPQDMRDIRVSTSNIVYITERRAGDLNRHRVKPNDLLFSRRGDLSRCSYMGPENEGWLCGTGCLLLRLPATALNGYWLAHAYKHPRIQSQVLGMAVGSTMANLNSSILASIRVASPPIWEQETFENIIMATNEQLEDENIALGKLCVQKAGLMDDLLTGHVRVTPLLEQAQQRKA